MNITSLLGDGSPRQRRRELSRYVSHEGESIYRGDTPTVGSNFNLLHNSQWITFPHPVMPTLLFLYTSDFRGQVLLGAYTISEYVQILISCTIPGESLFPPSHAFTCIPLYVWFSRIGSAWCLYHFWVYSNFNLLHNSRWITFPTQSCLYFIPLYVWFSRIGSAWCLYHFWVYSNFNLLHNSRWITFPTQSCLHFYPFIRLIFEDRICLVLIPFLSIFKF